MPRGDLTAVPSVCLWLIRAASWIVPGPDRRAWKRQRAEEAAQYAALLAERGEPRRAVRAKLLAFSRQAFGDATRRRIPDAEPRTLVRRAARGPGFFFVLTAVFLSAITLGTGLFSAVRTLARPLPYSDAGRLVSCYQVHFLSLSWGVQARYIRPWRDKGQTLAGLEAYRADNFRVALPGATEVGAGGARVTAGFFALLGARPAYGRLFQPLDDPAETPVIVGYEFWRRHLGSDPGVVGKRVTINGRPLTVIGVLPKAFWFRSPDIGIWVLLPDLGHLGPAAQLVNAVGRLKPGSTPEQAREELEQIAFSTSRFRGGAFRVVPLERSLRPAFQFPLLSFLAGVLLATGMALTQFLRSWGKHRESVAQAGRYWSFFPAKALLLLGGMTALGAELEAHNALALHPSKLMLGLLIDWASVLVTLLVLRWAILDQSRRCPVCLRRLGVPVTSGTWGSSLLEPASTEMLCDQGHGALRFGESHTTLGEIRRWIAMEDSWRELLASEDKTK